MKQAKNNNNNNNNNSGSDTSKEEKDSCFNKYVHQTNWIVQPVIAIELRISINLYLVIQIIK